MELESWNIERWRSIFETVGSLAAICFTALALVVDVLVRKAQTNIELTKQHREIWDYYYEHPELHGLAVSKRDLADKPLSGHETYFVTKVLNHLRSTYYARKAWIFTQPECLQEDINSFFSLPAPLAAWQHVKKYHDTKFVAFVERNMR